MQQLPYCIKDFHFLMTMLWCPQEILRYGDAKPLLLLILVSFLRQKLQGKLLSTAGTYPHFTQRVSDHGFVANSLSIYFPTNLIHLDSEVFFIFSPADITMSEIKSSFPSSSLCYIQVNYQIYYRKCAALIQTPSQATQQSPEHFAESGALTS